MIEVKSSRNWRRSLKTVGRIMETRYPPFIFGLPLAKNEIPVFTYHDIVEEEFAADLAYIKYNGYRTLSLAEFVERSDTADPGRCVLLTFDDARRNFFDVALPVLERFDCRATLFVPTAWVGATDAPAVPAALSRRMFMEWDEVRRCDAHPLVDVEVHSHRHGLIYTSDRLVGFATPPTLARFDIFDWPMRKVDGEDRLGFPPPGTPVYEAAPILGADRRFEEDDAVVNRCVETVAAHGGDGFFEAKGWEGRLRRVHDEVRASRPKNAPVDDTVFEELVRSEFVLSRLIFERELGRQPRTFAYPWRLGSTRSLVQAAKAGIEAAFGVALDYRRIGRMQGSVRLFGRLKGDWLQSLPGAQRRTLWRILPDKIAGFAGTQHLAH